MESAPALSFRDGFRFEKKFYDYYVNCPKSMPDLIKKALTAKRESKLVEFKQGFDPSSPAEWCEIIKDIIAIANSGGGIVVFGLDNNGTPTKTPVDTLGRVDPADITNRITKYTGPVELEFEVRDL
ncbi:MAG: AlbA family DNA-binding domain-containing protein, partial [Burkholderiales bacterium]